MQLSHAQNMSMSAGLELEQRLEFLNQAQEIERAMLENWYHERAELALGNMEEMVALNANYNEQVLQMAEMHSSQQMALDSAMLDHKKQTTQQYLQAAATISSSMALLFGENKKVAYANILVQGAVAQMNALSLQPYLPVGLAASIQAGAATVAAIQQVSSANAKNRGGVIEGSDQIYRVNEGGRQEGIINNQGLNAIGGESGLNALNNGRIDQFISNFSSLNTGPQTVINVNGGVVSQEWFDNEMVPMIERKVAFR